MDGLDGGVEPGLEPNVLGEGCMITSLDWNEVWKERMAKSIESGRGRDCVDNWSNKHEASNYGRMLVGYSGRAVSTDARGIER